MSLAQLYSGKLLAGVLPKSLPLSLIISVLLLSTLWARAAEPLGATPHSDGSTTFRVWAPFVDAVAVKINGGTAVPLAREDGHPDPTDTTWVGTVPGARAGDKYRYAIRREGVTREFNDPRARQLTGFDLPDGFGLAGNDDKPQSVIADPNFSMPAFTEPTFNTMVIYEMHIGTFNNTFAGAVEKLDYLADLGVNAVEVLPITQNPLFSDHTPPDQRQIAVIVDVVYNHLVENNLLKEFGGFTRPEIPSGIYLYGGDRANTGFGPRPDYGRPQVRQYIIDNALQLLRYGSTIRLTFALSVRDAHQITKERNCFEKSTVPTATPTLSTRVRLPSPKICKALVMLRCKLAQLASNSTANGMTRWSTSCVTL